MTKYPTHSHLRDILARLYPTQTDAQRIASDARIAHAQVPQDAKMINYWHGLLQEARHQEKIAALFDCVKREYPHNQELAQALAAHQREERPLSNIHLMNFAHPLTAAQQEQIEDQLDKRLDLSLYQHHPALFVDDAGYEAQCIKLANKVGFTMEEWKSLPILINPPSFVPGALCLLAELHGRMRHFPTVIRMRPVILEGTRSFAVAEILNLQEIRDRARNRG